MKNIFSVEFFVKKNGSYGSVTIFLTMILLPMLLLMITLTDYAKIMVAKRQVSGAGDMALSAGLSYYDEYLKDMYGLFAVSKSTEELQDGLEEYFTNTLLGEGLDVDSPFLQDIKNIFTGSNSEKDAYLKLINLQKQAFTISEVEGANFANATLLNNQIMDYMEFRGPIVLATGIIDKIGSFKQLNEEKNAAKEKVKFEKKLQKSENTCKNAYEKINKYNEALDTLNVKDMKNLIAEANEEYKEAVRYIFLIQKNDNKQNTKNAKPLDIEKNNSVHENEISNIYSHLKDVLFSDNSNYKIKINKLLNMESGDNAEKKAEYLYAYNETVKLYNDKKIGGYGEKLRKLIESEGKTYKEIEENAQKDAVNADRDIKNIIFNMLQLSDIDNNTRYGLMLGEFIDKSSRNYYQKLYRMENGIKTINKYLDELEIQAEQYYRDYDNDKKDNIKETIKNLRGAVTNWTESQQTIKGNNKEQNEKMGNYKTVLNEYDKHKAYFSKGGKCYDIAHEIWENRVNFVDDTIKKGNDNIKALEEIVNAVITKLNEAIEAVGIVAQEFENLELQRGTWQEKIDVLSGESKTSMQSDLDEEAGDIDSKSARKCEEYLKSSRDTLNNFLKEIKEIKKSFNEEKKIDAENAAKYYTKSELGSRRDESDKYFETFIKIDDSFIKEDAIPKKITEKDNKFYKYLVKAVKNKAKTDDNEKKDAESCKNNLLKNNSKSSSGASGVSDESGSSGDASSDTASSNSLRDKSLRELYTDPTLPSKGEENAEPGKTEITESGGSINENSLDGDYNIMKLISEGIEIINNCVEDIYLTEYIMNMFTYRTYNRNEDGTAIKDGLVSLSGYSYNTKSPLYAAEAEYTLWGMDTAQKNLDATYAAIFGIRFLMNAIYALTDSTINAQTNAVATALVGFTGFGIPIMQTVLDLGLALLETVMDMRMLIQGRPVAIYKNKDTWVCSLNGMKNAVVTEVKIMAAQKASQLANKAIDMLQTCAVEELDKVADDLTENLTRQASVAVDTIVSTIIQRVEEKLSAVSIGNCVSDEEIRKSLDKWVTDFKNQLGVPDSPPTNKENVTDYVLYYAYQKINTPDFKNKMANKIIELQKKAETETNNIKVSDYSAEVSSYVEQILGIKKEKKPDGNYTYTEVFGLNYNSIISNAIKDAKNDIKDFAMEKTEDAREKINERISKYSENLLSSKSNTSTNKSATGNTVTKSSSAALTMDYKEYLTMFILLSSVVNKEYEKHLLRVSDLIQINVGQAKKDDGFNSKFAMAKCKTHLKAEATVSGNTFFTGTAYLKNTENNIYLKDSNGMYGIKYIGVDGY